MSLRRRQRTIVACAAVLFGACGVSRNAGDRILGDETFFEKSLAPIVVQARDQCKKNLETEFAPERLAPGTNLTQVSSSVGINIPPDLQPKIDAIEAKYGKSGNTEEGVRFYGDVGFLVGTGSEDGKVTKIVLACTLKDIRATP